MTEEQILKDWGIVDIVNELNECIPRSSKVVAVLKKGTHEEFVELHFYVMDQKVLTSKIQNKSKVLYGFRKLRRRIRNRLIIWESALDGFDEVLG